MKKFLILFLLIVGLFAKELVITKYLENKPDIVINFKGPKPVEKILKMDFTVLEHFNVKYDSNETNNTAMDFNITYNKPQKILDVKYFHNNTLKFLIRKVVYSLLEAPKEASIYLSDYTLSYKKLLITGGLNIFPRWADVNQTTIYFTKYQRLPTLYKYNIYTGKLQKILSSQGLLIVSDVNYAGCLFI